MALPEHNEPPQFDFRVYVGIIFFRWQIIALFFLYSLLGGILFIHLSPKIYQTSCNLLIYKDPSYQVSEATVDARWMDSHRYLLQGSRLRLRVVDRLAEAWSQPMGGRGKMALPVTVYQVHSLGPTLNVSIKGPIPAYNEAFLTTLLEEHKAEWRSVQMESTESASRLLEKELVLLEEKIRKSEDDLIEYQRLHDIARVSARGTMESAYLGALMGRRNQLTTELMLLEAQTPVLKEVNAGVLRHVGLLTRETGAVRPAADREDVSTGEDAEEGLISNLKAMTPAHATPDDSAEEEKGWQELRVKLLQLEQREKELLDNMEPSHPSVVSVRKEIQKVQASLAIEAEIQLRKLKDRHAALTIQLNALETAEYQWQAKNLLASQRSGELKRIAAVVKRYESNYDSLYSRLHNLRATEELKAGHFRIVDPVSTPQKPLWPDPMKILLMALVLGLGSGMGLALVAQIFDNKIQSISDVVAGLKIPFLGGVPYWVHSGLERSIRPIVTEEHSTGAVEAYRALRTSVLAELKKMNEKIVFITSADSREGKTLTALNLAIMIAQMNYRVLLVDLDLRRGRLHRSLGLEREPGVTDALKEHKSLRGVIRATRIENLFLAPTGSTIESSAELLQSADLVSLFMDIRDEYDYILLDTSPVLRVTDTVIATTRGIGVVLYVARVNKTPKPLVRYSLDMLKDARILGLVMNSIEMHKISSLYYTYQYPNYAYYSNAYAYGYNYYYYGDGTGSRMRKNRGTLEQKRRDLVQWLRRTFLPME